MPMALPEIHHHRQPQLPYPTTTDRHGRRDAGEAGQHRRGGPGDGR